MKLKHIYIRNFRNLDYINFALNEKSLIIGQNDIGKSNLIDAIRLLLDTDLSEESIIPKNSDFNKENGYFSIVLEFDQVPHRLIKDLYGDSENNEVTSLSIGYIGKRERPYMVKSFKLYAFTNISEEQRILVLSGRTDKITFGSEILRSQLTKYIKLKYVSAHRDFSKMIEENLLNLISTSRRNLTDEDIEHDSFIINSISHSLDDNTQAHFQGLKIFQEIQNLINTELEKLSNANLSQEINLGIELPSNDNYLNLIKIIPRERGGTYERKLGGQGRINQLYFVLWNLLTQNSKQEIIYVIEEPETHLHPHQQRQMSKYLIENIASQLIITTHSPFIIRDFSIKSIIRLHTEPKSDYVKLNLGSEKKTKEAIDNMEFRRSFEVLETYFSNFVFLVEGPSEEIFYRTLARHLDINLDLLNVSIQSVYGVGFNKYIDLYTELKIPYIIRTDNDIQTVRTNKKCILLGMRRAILFAKNNTLSLNKSDLKKMTAEKNEFSDQHLKSKIKQKRICLHADFYPILAHHGVYLSKIDLETDLVTESSPELKKCFKNFLDLSPTCTDEDIIEKMKKKKATFMYQFTTEYGDQFKSLKEANIANPLFYIQNFINRTSN